ncbi:unnamed protein product [Trichobilharzia szidati]|nr:unnamed protein product [Trichobilharzia szidati]
MTSDNTMADDLEGNRECAKQPAKSGRRAKSIVKEKNGLICENSNSQKSPEIVECGDFPERKVAVWNEDDISHSVSYGRRAQDISRDISDFTSKQDSDEELEIPIIPDVGSAEDGLGDSHTAAAPNVIVNKIPSFRELNQELINHGALPALDNDINLSVLTKHLFSEAELQERDETWDWDRLFADILARKESVVIKPVS